MEEPDLESGHVTKNAYTSMLPVLQLRVVSQAWFFGSGSGRIRAKN